MYTFYIIFDSVFCPCPDQDNAQTVSLLVVSLPDIQQLQMFFAMICQPDLRYILFVYT